MEETPVDAGRAPSQDQLQIGGEDSGLSTQYLTPTPSSRHSFDSDSEKVTVVVGRTTENPWKAPMKEPEWEVVSKPTQPLTSQEHPSSAPLAKRVDSQLESKTQMIAAAPRSADRTIAQNATQTTVGVARTISVSRAQRPELLKTRLLRSATTSSERLVDKKPLTPTLVELKNRKSQRVLLVDA